MMGNVSKEIFFFFSVTCICATRGILTTSPTEFSSFALSYLPPRGVSPATRIPSSRNPIYANHKYDDDDDDDDDVEAVRSAGERKGQPPREDNGYANRESRPTAKVSLASKDEIPTSSSELWKLVSSTSRYRTRFDGRFAPRAERYLDPSKDSNLTERHRSVLLGSSYKVIEEDDEEEGREVDEQKGYFVGQNVATEQAGSYRGKKPDRTNPYRDSQDITRAIGFLDRFLSRTLNGDGYNVDVHPPPNPVLALVLSRYGRYVPGPQNPRLYSYMAVNNIHNNRPFGRYKQEREEEPRYVASR